MQKIILMALMLAGAFLIASEHANHANNPHSGHNMGGHSATNAEVKTPKNEFLIIMDKMMVAMDAAISNASVEEDFLAQMRVHHQGAIQMAEYEIANGKDFAMIQLAKSILVEQNSEIKKMDVLLPLYRQKQITKVSDEYRQMMTKTMTEMMATTPNAQTVFPNVDYAFAAIMLPHHQAAIAMALAILPFTKDQPMINLARKIIADQEVEIAQMKSFIDKSNTALFTVP